jgi:hypothetical protein
MYSAYETRHRHSIVSAGASRLGRKSNGSCVITGHAVHRGQNYRGNVCPLSGISSVKYFTNCHSLVTGVDYSRFNMEVGAGCLGEVGFEGFGFDDQQRMWMCRERSSGSWDLASCESVSSRDSDVYLQLYTKRRKPRERGCRLQKGKELNDFQRNLLDIEILSNLRFGSLEIRDTSVTRVTNNSRDFFFSLSKKQNA